MVLAACATAQAAAPAPPPDPPLLPYDTLDADHDGIVTLPEITVHAPHLARRLSACDRNGDRRLTREEYARCGPAPAAPAPDRR
ncbi:MAG: hypothetical protein DI564_11480 [Rhodanobacter denitrificans]|uniref:EF-hand domain-containing protein n=1 Tax=Rhodanobacter denitrificans TaxID=666685 RepID=A0A2W5KFA9_9GAMM|nr:MAG: hypothetical protein DI564_11480 [Rhodanobacter denitrificans]